MSAPQTRLGAAATAPRDRKHKLSRNDSSSTGSPFERLLSAHQSATGYREQRTGKGARITCAACGTKAYKVSIAEAADGTVLLHAFCGHAPHEVLSAIGLTVSALFVRRDLRTMTPTERSQLRQAALLPRWRAAMEVLVTEASVVLIGANQLGDGEALDADGLTRLRVAALRIFDAREVLQ